MASEETVLKKGALIVCVPAKSYWMHLIQGLLTHDSPMEKAKRDKRLDDYDHIVPHGTTVEQATASALDVLRDAKVRYTSDMLQLFVGEQRGGLKLWGVYIEPRASGFLAAMHRSVRGQVMQWNRLLKQLRFAAIPAVLTAVCSFVADAVGLSVSQLVTGRLQGVLAVASTMVGGSAVGTVLQYGFRTTVLYSPQWQQLRETISLFIVPHLIALLSQLFPGILGSVASGEGKLILDSAALALRDMAKTRKDRAEMDSRQNVVALFLTYTKFLRLPTPHSRQARDVISAASSTHSAVAQLLRATSANETMKAFFGVAQAVLFGARNASVIGFARSASMVMGETIQRGAAIWKDAGYNARHSKALQAAGRLRTPLATWAEVSADAAAAFAAGEHQRSAREAVSEVLEALDGAYRIRVAEDLRMSTCQGASQVLKAATNEWVHATHRLLYPAEPDPEHALTGKEAADALAQRRKLRSDIAAASSLTIGTGLESGVPWPDLEAMDEELAFRVHVWARHREQASEEKCTASHNRSSIRKRRRSTPSGRRTWLHQAVAPSD